MGLFAVVIFCSYLNLNNTLAQILDKLRNKKPEEKRVSDSDSKQYMNEKSYCRIPN